MSVTSRKRLLAKLKNKAYRDAYTAEHVKTTTPLQIRTVREQHEWTQGKLAAEAKTTQTAISRTEDPNYGNLTLNNLLKIAAALDVGLLVKLVPFSRLVQEYEDLSPESLSTSSFMEELSALEAWADGTHKTTMAPPDAMNPRLRLTSSAAGHYQQDIPLLKLPALGESFALNFPAPGPVIVRDERRGRSLSVREPLREVS
jgi:transcriptional regulator with XRE-family HTH domain